MIRHLRIKNFQAHKRLVVELDPHITTFVGPSDRGKSSIVRALRWLALNTLRGTSFIRHGKKEASVAVTTERHVVMRRRGRARNQYALNGEILEAMGARVPSQVADALQLSEVNFQQQHDAPFWFSETSGQVSRELNELIDLGAIDSVLSYLNSKIRETTVRGHDCEQRIREARQQRRQLIYTKQADRELKEIEDQEALLQHLGDQSNQLEDCLQECLTLKEKLKEELPDLSDIEEGAQTLDELSRAISELERTLQAIVEQLRTMNWTDQEIKREEREWARRVGTTCPLCGQPTRR
jgi:exonuclease SbcC